MDGLHDQPHQHRAFRAEFLQIDFLRVVRTVHRLAVMDEVAHLHIQKQRLIRIFHIEGIKRAVFGNYGHIGFAGEVPDGSLHADDVLRTVGFSGN